MNLFSIFSKEKKKEVLDTGLKKTKESVFQKLCRVVAGKKEVDDERFEQQIAVKIPQIAAAQYVDDFPENQQKENAHHSTKHIIDFCNSTSCYVTTQKLKLCRQLFLCHIP